MYILALDGGGTKTLARLYNLSGDVIKEAIGPSSNIWSVPYSDLKSQFGEFILTNFGDYLKKKVFLSGGMAGAGREKDVLTYCNFFKELGFKNPFITSDAYCGLVGAHGKSEGALLICGTGSMALYIDSSHEIRVGGWGHILGDEGSGYYIGLEALKAVMKISDGRLPDSLLKKKIFKHFHASSHQDLIPIVYGNLNKKVIAELAEYVFSTHDEISENIIENSAVELLQMLLTLKEKSEATILFVTLSGGILENSTPVKRALLKKLPGTGIFVSEKIGDACYGAFLIAKEKLENR